MKRSVPKFLSAMVMAGWVAATAAALPSATARAETLSISGAALLEQCPCDGSGIRPNVDRGVLVPTVVTKLYAAVDFPVNGQQICSLSMVYQDTNSNDNVVTRLYRKAVAVGGNPFASPTLVVAVSSAAGTINTVRVSKTTNVALPTIDDTTGSYFLQITVPTVNLNILGVQIDYRPSCP